MGPTRFAPTNIKLLIEDVHGEIVEMADKAVKAGYIDELGRLRILIKADVLFATFAAEMNANDERGGFLKDV